jgi:hypothetical protein
MWPGTIVKQLSHTLPPEFTAEPRVHLGTYFEMDVCSSESDEQGPVVGTSSYCSSADALVPPLVIETDLIAPYAYEVLVYDQSRGRILVAAVEIVSPGNKDRPETRQAFVAKCATLLQQRVCVSMVDLVTTRHFSLYADLLDLIGQRDPAFGPTPPSIYAVTCRGR